MKTQGEWAGKPLLRPATTAAPGIIRGVTRTNNKTARAPKATDNVVRGSSDVD